MHGHCIHLKTFPSSALVKYKIQSTINIQRAPDVTAIILQNQ